MATGSGSFDANVLGLMEGASAESGGINPASDAIVTGPNSANAEQYGVSLTGPASFGSGGATSASVGTGDVVALSAFPVSGGLRSGTLDLPINYIANALLNDTSSYDNTTFASLGLKPGTYIYDLGPVSFGPKGALGVAASRRRPS